MKRTVSALVLAAAVGGCMSSNPKPAVQDKPTVRAWTRQGLPHLRAGGRLVRFNLEAVEKWLAQKRHKAGGRSEARGSK